MPQKRNPVALEHARAIGSKAVGQASAIVLSVHNTPFGDIVDTEDDLQPLVTRMFTDAARAVSLVAAAMEEAMFDVAALAARANQGWITVTELADTLAREHDLPFKTGHAIASRFITAAKQNPAASLSTLLRDISRDLAQREIVYSDAQLAEILSAKHFVEVRTTLGGPAPSETERAASVSEAAVSADETWLRDARAGLKRADHELHSAAAAL
jgi:argininosuccinate lyase